MNNAIIRAPVGEAFPKLTPIVSANFVRPSHVDEEVMKSFTNRCCGLLGENVGPQHTAKVVINGNIARIGVVKQVTMQLLHRKRRYRL